MRYAYKKRLYIFLASVFDIIGGILFSFRYIFKKPVPEDPRNILVVRLDHIGDFVCTTPIFKNIKKRFPRARLTVLINSASKELAYRDPDIDKVITFSPHYLARSEKSSPFKGLMRVIKDVRALGFDLGIDPRGDILSIIIMWLGGVKYRAGYGITGGGFLLNKKENYNNTSHVIDRNLALLKGLNIPVEERSPSVYFSEKDKEAVEGLLRVVKMEDKGVVLHPFAGAPSREWTRDNFQKLIDRLKNNNISILLIGTKNDIGGYDNVIDMRGRFSLPQLAYFIKRTGYFIGLNSGPANIAAALGVPSVVISSGTNIIEDWIPDNKNVKFVYKNIDCRPCERAACQQARQDCMDGITVDDVLSKFNEIVS